MKRLRINQRTSIGGPRALTRAPWLAALREAIEWALDRASQIASPYPEEQEAVERVRAFVDAQLAGVPAELDLDDALLTLGILIAEIGSPPPSDLTLRAIDRVGGVLPDWHRRRGQPPFGGPPIHHCPGAHSVGTHRLPHVLYA